MLDADLLKVINRPYLYPGPAKEAIRKLGIEPALSFTYSRPVLRVNDSKVATIPDTATFNELRFALRRDEKELWYWHCNEMPTTPPTQEWSAVHSFRRPAIPGVLEHGAQLDQAIQSIFREIVVAYQWSEVRYFLRADVYGVRALVSYRPRAGEALSKGVSEFKAKIMATSKLETQYYLHFDHLAPTPEP